MPLLGLAGVAFFLATPNPRLALALLLALLLVMSGVGGALMPAWMDVMGRAIPTALRGRFFAAAHLLASGGGLLASVATAAILAAIAPPAGYGVCFLAGAAFLGLSYLALSQAREPESGDAAPPVPLRTYLGRIPAMLRRDANLRRFLLARSFGMLGSMAIGFFAVFALRAYAAPDSLVGFFTALLMAGQMSGTVLLGWLADRIGHRFVLLAGLMAVVAANLVAAAAPSLAWFSVAFALAGVHLAAINISARTVLLEFAPAAGERPTYLGIGNTALAPVSFGAPLLAGLLADAVGFAPVFLAAVVCGLAGLALMTRVQEPRRRPNPQTASPIR